MRTDELEDENGPCNQAAVDSEDESAPSDHRDSDATGCSRDTSCPPASWPRSESEVINGDGALGLERRRTALDFVTRDLVCLGTGEYL